MTCAAITLLIAGCGGDDQPSQAKETPHERGILVETALVEMRPVHHSVSVSGAVEAFETVTITARVAGAVEKVAFVEGDAASANQVLVEIEPQRFRLVEIAARASLAKAEAAKTEADFTLSRREAMSRSNPGLVRDEDVQFARARSAVVAAELDQAKAALAVAQLDLSNALVRPPTAGVIQTRTVHTGQYVQPGAVLATLTRRDPLLLRFEISADEAARLNEKTPFTFVVGDGAHVYHALITHIASSGTSRLVGVMAKVDDPGQAELRPGLPARITIPLGTVEAPVIPQSALCPNGRGLVVYVVIEDHGRSLVKERFPQLGAHTQNGWVEVLSGLAKGDRLVVRGSENLREGALVSPSASAVISPPADASERQATQRSP